MIPQQHRQNIELVYSDAGRSFFKQAQEKLKSEEVNKLKAVWASKGPEVAMSKFYNSIYNTRK